MGQPWWYRNELAEAQARRENADACLQTRGDREETANALFGAFAEIQPERAFDPDANPDYDSDCSLQSEADEMSAKVGALADAILAGTAPAEVLDRAARCVADLCRATGKPAAFWFEQAACSVADSVVRGL